jgi:hypothetical protein
MEILFFCLIVAFAGWTSITMSIQQAKKIRYHYYMKNLEVLLHVSLLIISPIVFFAMVFFGFFLIYMYDVLLTGQL